jgi:DNA invertase Pin-like site-specific DNA recombinase
MSAGSSTTACGNLRTSSEINAGDKGSQARQRDAIEAYAKAHGLEVVGWYYDEGVSGTVPIEQRPQFVAMLDYMYGNGARTILLADPSRLARDAFVAEFAYQMLQKKGIALVAVNEPELFTDDETGMRKLIRTIIGAISAFERDGIVHKLRVARDRASAKAGRRVEGRPPFPDTVVAAAKKLHRPHRKTGQRRSLREISFELAKLGHLSSTGKPYVPESVKRMLGRAG